MSSSGQNPGSLQQFYKPYHSDEESSGTESDSDSYSSFSTSSSSSSGTLSDSKTFEKPIAKETRQLLFSSGYATLSDVSGNTFIPPASSPNIPYTLNQTKTTFTTTKTATTVMINSRDRDTDVYEFPSFFTIRLPRVYKNVVSLNVTQIKMLSAFYYFSDTKCNNTMRFYENGRKNIDIFIKNGTYDMGALTTEIQNRINMAAIYSTLSYNEFSLQFPNTGDFTLLFNYPGDTTFNNLTGNFDALAAKSDIAGRYFTASNALGIARYTDKETLVAYYYPLLKDLTIYNNKPPSGAITSPYTNVVSRFSNLNPIVYDPIDYKLAEGATFLNGHSYYDRIVFSFSGVADGYIYLIVSDPKNRVILDKFKKDNGWQNHLVNKYVLNYDPQAGRVAIYTRQLNTSIYNDLTNEYTNILTAAIVQNGLNPAQINGLSTIAQNLNGTLIDMYNFLQNKFTNFFGINYGTYSSTFFSDKTNKIYIYDSLGRYGWSLTYSGQAVSDSSKTVYTDSPNYWTNLPITTASAIKVGNEIFFPNPGGGPNVRYTYTNNAIKDVSGNIVLNGSSETTFGYQDININIMPTSYSKTNFQSNCRQTLFIETLPAVGGQLIESFNLDKVNTPLLIDKFGEYLIDTDAPDFNFFEITQNMLDGADFMRSLDKNGKGFYLKFAREIKPVVNENLVKGNISIYPYQAHIFFKINHGNYPVVGSDKSVFASDIYIEREDGLPIGVNAKLYWYEDRSAFMADVKSALNNKNLFNPKFHIRQELINANETTHIFTADFISGENSFLMLIADLPKVPVGLRVFSVRNKPYGIYSVAGPNSLSLRKIATDLDLLSSKADPSKLFPVDYTSLFDSPDFKNGYDKNGVSLNLLNNIILTQDFLHYDPYNFTDISNNNTSPLQYSFKYLSPAQIKVPSSGVWSQFFYPESQNVINNNGTIYYSSSLVLSDKNTYSQNEYIFTNWFRAGAITNLFQNSVLNPQNYPEQTFLPEIQKSFSDTSGNFVDLSGVPIGFSSGPSSNSPFSICLNTESRLSTDIFPNDISSISNSTTGIIGIPFLPPPSSSVLPTKIVIKFSYTQPVSNLNGILSRTSSLTLLNNDNYAYTNFSSSVKFKGVGDLGLWDDKYRLNRRNLLLGVFYCKDIIGLSLDSINISKAISTLTLKKVVQTGIWNTYANGNRTTKKRSPEWGTYYVYEKTDVSGNVWFPYSETIKNNVSNTTWKNVQTPVDVSNYAYTGSFQKDSELGTYYSDVTGNSLCFIPFYPKFMSPVSNRVGAEVSLKPDSWSAGTFTGLSYTNRPYVPFANSEALSINPYLVYRKNTSANVVENICIEDLSGDGLALGLQSSYYGICGPFCLTSNNNNLCQTSNFATKPMFFNIRLNCIKNPSTYNPITDSSVVSLAKQCYLDTHLFLYNDTLNPGSSTNDIVTGWAQEKTRNFITTDNNSGYNYLSYLNQFPADPNNIYNINVRSILPTASFNARLRISGKNWTDFGYLSLEQLGNEIDDLVNNGVNIGPNGILINNAYRIKKRYTYNYTIALLEFNKSFIGKNTFGIGFANPTYAGVVLTTAGFSDFLTQYGEKFKQINTSSQPIINAQNLASANITKYIAKNYAGVLPDYAITRNLYTEPLLFSILFKSALQGTFATSFDQWGLGWNLGFNKADTELSTRHVSQTFIRIVDDFLYLKLNDEFNMNTIDISDKEQLNKNRDTFGKNKAYFGKLLLNSFGSFSQTFIQSNKGFVVPLAKLDKLAFSFFDGNNNQIFNTDCEFNLVIDISESLDWLDPNSVIVKGAGATPAPPPPASAPGAPGTPSAVAATPPLAKV